MQYFYDWRVYWHQESISMTVAYPMSIPYSWFHHMPTLLVFSQVAEESDLFNIPDLLLVFFKSVGQITILEPRCCLFKLSFLQVWCDNGINWRTYLIMFILHDLIFWVNAWYVKEPKPSGLSYPSIIFLLKLRNIFSRQNGEQSSLPIFRPTPLKKSCMLVPQASSTITTTSRASDDVLVHGWKRNSMLRGPSLVSHKSVWKWTIPICGHLGNRGWSNLGAFSNSICSIRGAPKSQFASDAHPSGESQSWCCRTSRFATTPILRFYVVYPASRADLALLFILLVMYIYIYIYIYGLLIHQRHPPWVLEYGSISPLRFLLLSPPGRRNAADCFVSRENSGVTPGIPW